MCLPSGNAAVYIIKHRLMYSLPSFTHSTILTIIFGSLRHPKYTCLILICRYKSLPYEYFYIPFTKDNKLTRITKDSLYILVNNSNEISLFPFCKMWMYFSWSSHVLNNSLFNSPSFLSRSLKLELTQENTTKYHFTARNHTNHVHMWVTS